MVAGVDKEIFAWVCVAKIYQYGGHGKLVLVCTRVGVWGFAPATS